MNYNSKEIVQNINQDIPKISCLKTLQVNLGDMCNQYCSPCYVNGESKGNKVMGTNVMEKIIYFLKKHPGIFLDITGGCPELNPNFVIFVKYANEICPGIMVRTNLSIFSEEGMQWLPEWYKEHKIMLIVSLPLEKKLNKQCEDGMSKKSIKVLKKLNKLGYGEDLTLNIIYNPVSELLQVPQKKLEEDYIKELLSNYGIKFNNLFTHMNAPPGRFESYLDPKSKMECSRELLMDNFNPEMSPYNICRSLAYIDWQGDLYNCCFNQAAGFPVKDKFGKIMKINDLKDFMYDSAEIVNEHQCCYCTIEKEPAIQTH